MYVCMYDSTYVCMYVCMYSCMYVCMYVNICVCMCVCIHTSQSDCIWAEDGDALIIKYYNIYICRP